jgi:protein-tyrosine phosphatase
MAAGFLREGAAPSGLTAQVASAGTHANKGRAAEPFAIEAMEDFGIDIGGHQAHPIAGADIRAADLVVTMARSHLMHVVAEQADGFAKTFTLKELVRRGVEAGPKDPDEPLASWLGRLGAGRRPGDLLGESLLDDVEDPIGQNRKAFKRTAEELDQLSWALIDLLCGFTPKGSERFVSP